MQSKKNALFFALLLNCIYFLGISFFVHRELSNKTEPLHGLTWLNNAAQAIAKGLIAEQALLPQIMNEILQTQNSSQKLKIAQNYNLSALIELTGEDRLDILGKRSEIPFPSGHFDKQTIGFHKNDKSLFFTYLWRVTETQKRFFLSTEKPIAPVLEQLSVFGIDLTVVEKELEQKRVLFSSFTSETAQDLLAQTPFENQEIDSTPRTLNKEKYLMKIVPLSKDPNLQQKMIFTLKIPNYEAISLTEILIYVWTFFCISVVFLFLVFRKFELSDKPQEHL